MSRERTFSKRKKELFEKIYPTMTVSDDKLLLDVPLILEIGFGKGEHILSLLQQNPSCHVVGIERYQTGVISLLDALPDIWRSRVSLWFGEAGDFFAQWPSVNFYEIYTLFLDPWPKRRHYKRRFFQPNIIHTLMAYVRVKRGCLYFVHDDAMYTHAFIEMVSQAGFTLYPWQVTPALSRYATKAVRNGRVIYGYQVTENKPLQHCE